MTKYRIKKIHYPHLDYTLYIIQYKAFWIWWDEQHYTNEEHALKHFNYLTDKTPITEEILTEGKGRPK